MTLKNIARLLFLLLIAAVVVSSQEYPPPNPPPPMDEQTIGSLGVQVITQFLTGDFVKRKLQLLFDVIDLKARLIHVITSFCTTDNLIALRRFLDWVCRFSTFINQFLPSLPDENPKTALLGLVFNLINGVLSQPATEASYVPALNDYNTPSSIVYSPPTAFETPQLPDENNNLSDVSQDLSVNVKRSLEPSGEAEIQEAGPKLTDLSEDEIRKMLNNHQGVMTLSKLLSASKRR